MNVYVYTETEIKTQKIHWTENVLSFDQFQKNMWI